MYWWEMNMLNQSLCDGDPEPYWYWNPKNLLIFWKEFACGTATQEPG